MLVLTRKPNQQIRIGNDIVVTVVKVRGNTIRLGIEAPQDVRVMRSELEAKSEGNTTLTVESMTVTFDCIDSGDAKEEETASEPSIDQRPSLKYPGPSKGAVSKDKLRFGGSPFASKGFGLQADKVEDSPLCHRPLADKLRSVQSKAKPASPAEKKIPGVA